MLRHDERVVVSPFLKWAGGKRWLVRDRRHLLPGTFRRYIEPFLGSGAVFFHLKPQDALLGDSNQALVDTYQGIKNDCRKVEALLRRHQCNHGEQYYYQMREHNPRTLAAKAARLIYLNRTCWNGLYRVNTKGRFNVPIGSKSSILRRATSFLSILLTRSVIIRTPSSSTTKNFFPGTISYALPLLW
jgi:DNA adenine methylase